MNIMSDTPWHNTEKHSVGRIDFCYIKTSLPILEDYSQLAILVLKYNQMTDWVSDVEY